MTPFCPRLHFAARSRPTFRPSTDPMTGFDDAIPGPAFSRARARFDQTK